MSLNKLKIKSEIPFMTYNKSSNELKKNPPTTVHPNGFCHERKRKRKKA